MSSEHYLKTRVPEDVKTRVHALADQEFITESIWLKRMRCVTVRVRPQSTARLGQQAQFIDPGC